MSPRLRSGFVKVGRLSVHHTHGGRGSPVLLIHGLGSSGYIEWRFTMPALARAHRVFAPDLPGFGRSQKPRARYGIRYFARVLDRYMEGRRLSSAAVVGSWTMSSSPTTRTFLTYTLPTLVGEIDPSRYVVRVPALSSTL